MACSFWYVDTLLELMPGYVAANLDVVESGSDPGDRARSHWLAATS